MAHLAFIGKRLWQLLPVLFGITLVVFFMIHLIPGDPAATLLGNRSTPQAVAALRQQFGLDEPLYRQYLDFLGRIAHGDLGSSFVYKSPVRGLVEGRISSTLWLLAAGALFSLLLSVPLAVLAASRKDAVRDQAVRIVPLIGLGMPAVWVGLMLQLFFALKLGLFPVSGFGTTVVEHAKSIVLPATTVAVALAPILVRSLRTSLLDVLDSDYVLTARAKGISRSRLLLHHALRNAAVSSVTVLGVNIAYLVGATVIVERVFALPGLGTLMLDSIYSRDFPVVQGVVIVIAVLVVLVNLATDLAHASLDPRVGVER